MTSALTACVFCRSQDDFDISNADLSPGEDNFVPTSAVLTRNRVSRTDKTYGRPEPAKPGRRKLVRGAASTYTSASHRPGAAQEPIDIDSDTEPVGSRSNGTDHHAACYAELLALRDEVRMGNASNHLGSRTLTLRRLSILPGGQPALDVAQCHFPR